MGECISIIPIFATDYIRMVISNDFSVGEDIIFKPAVRNIRELRIALLKSRNVVVLVCASKENINEIKEIQAFLEERKIPAIAVCDNSSLNYELMRNGFFSVTNFVPSGTSSQQKMLLSQIRLKAHDAIKIEAVLTKRNAVGNTTASLGGNNSYKSPFNKVSEQSSHLVKSKDTDSGKSIGFSVGGTSKSAFDNLHRESSSVLGSAYEHAYRQGSSIDTLIVIGASTGGTEALIEILKRLPDKIPPILIVQHMPAGFTKMYADRCDYFCKMKVQEAADGMPVNNGNAYIAPGEYHMRSNKSGSGYYLTCRKGDKVNGVCPSVDVLFDSVVDIMPKKTIGVILTGMGVDGASGLLKLRNRGAYTIGQSEKTCVVYGMPKEAYDRGAVKIQADIEDIAKIILENL